MSSLKPGNGLPGDEVTILFEDPAGSLWVGVDDELYVFESGKFKPIRQPDGSPIGFTQSIVGGFRGKYLDHGAARPFVPHARSQSRRASALAGARLCGARQRRGSTRRRVAAAGERRSHETAGWKVRDLRIPPRSQFRRDSRPRRVCGRLDRRRDAARRRRLARRQDPNHDCRERLAVRRHPLRADRSRPAPVALCDLRNHFDRARRNADVVEGFTGRGEIPDLRCIRRGPTRASQLHAEEIAGSRWAPVVRQCEHRAGSRSRSDRHQSGAAIGADRTAHGGSTSHFRSGKTCACRPTRAPCRSTTRD